MMKLAVIDGDTIAYRTAAACEKRRILAVHKETLEETKFNNVTEFRQWLAADGNFTEDQFTVTASQVAQPPENAFHVIKQTINSIVRKAKCDSYHIVVSGDNNFRLDLPLPTQYKSNRSASVRPLLLDDCKRYLIKKHNAEISDGVEADDYLVGYAYQGHKDGDYIVQCSPDKDARHGPCWLFDWTTMDAPELITGFGGLELILTPTAKTNVKGEVVNNKSVKGKGRAFLWYQILFGDPVDGYKPCELAKGRLGDIGAYELLKSAKNDKEALEVLVRQYKLWYPEPVIYRDWAGNLQTKDWLEIMQMYADCAFMRRFEGDRLIMKDVLDKVGVKYD
jgi:hypothetical protein